MIMYTILFYFLLTVVFTQMSSEVLFELKSKCNNKMVQWGISKLYCPKCFGFWCTLICTQNLFISLIVSAIFITIEKVEERI